MNTGPLRFTGVMLLAVMFSSSEVPANAASSNGAFFDPPGSKKSVSSLPPIAARQSRRSALMKRTWGIEVVGVHLVSAGYMLRFQYHVLDASKARKFSDRRIKPFLVDQKTGAKLMVPSPQKIGALRNSGSLETGRKYWIMFANPGRMVKPGSKVDVVVGDFRAHDLVVE